MAGFLRKAIWSALAVLVLWIVVSMTAVLALRHAPPPVSAIMLQQPGGRSGIDYRWTDRAAISRELVLAVIAAEDQKFLDHNGFDFGSIRQALNAHRAGAQLRGASTISQQVAKNLFLWSGRSFARKALEAYFTLLIESLWSKERILEVYLNVAEFGPGVFGVGAAAARFFDKPAAGLSRSEAALLAAVLPNPRSFRVDAPSAYVRSREAAIRTQIGVLETRGHYRGLQW